MPQAPSALGLNPERVQQFLQDELNGTAPPQVVDFVNRQRQSNPGMFPPPLFPQNGVGRVNTTGQVQPRRETLPAPPNPASFDDGSEGRRFGFMPTLNEGLQAGVNAGDKVGGVIKAGARMAWDTATDPEAVASLAGGAAGMAVGGPLLSVPAAGVAGAAVGGVKELLSAPKTGRAPSIGPIARDFAEGAAGQVMNLAGEKALAPFAKRVSPMGQKVYDTFPTPPGAERTAVMPADVTDSRIALSLEQAGRHAMIGGGPYEAAAKQGRDTERQVLSDYLQKNFGTQAIPGSPDEFRMRVSRTQPEAGTRFQKVRASNVKQANKAGSSFFDAVYDEADKSGLTVERPTGRMAAESDTLKEPYKQLGTMGKIARTVKRTFGPDDAASQMAGAETLFKEAEIGDTASNSIPSLEDFTTKKPQMESVGLRQLGQEYSDLNKDWRVLKGNPKTAAEARQAFLAMKAKDGEIKSLLAKDPKLAQLYEEARGHWREVRQTYDSPVVVGASKVTPDKFVKMLITGQGLKATEGGRGAMMTRKEMVKAIQGAAPQTVDRLKHSAVEYLMSDSVKGEGINAGSFQGHRMMQNMLANGEAYRQLFGNQHYTELLDLVETLAHKQRGKEDIGRMFWQMRQPGAVVGLASGTSVPSNLALLGAPSVLSRIMTNPQFTQWLTVGLKAGPKSKAGMAALAQLAAHLPSHTSPDDDLGQDDTSTDIPPPPTRP